MASDQEALQRLRDALVWIHEGAVVHDDDGRHSAARENSQAICALGHPCPEGREFRSGPACEALPGQRCITVPGHTLRDHYHPERLPQA